MNNQQTVDEDVFEQMKKNNASKAGAGARTY